MRGTFSEDEGPADGAAAVMGTVAKQPAPISGGVKTEQDAEALFASLFKEPSSGGDEVDPIEALAETVVQPAAAPKPAAPPAVTTTAAPAPAPARTRAAPVRSRAERFAPRELLPHEALEAATSADNVALSGPAVAAANPSGEPAAAPTKQASSRSRFVDQKQTPEAINARRSMAAAKVITPLVAAVSFAPGSTSPGGSKAKALSEMLVGMHQCAVLTAEAISTQTGQDVPSWLVTQLMSSLSTAIATRWQRGFGADLPALGQNMSEIFSGDDPALTNLIKGAAEDAYVEVNHPDVARFRISVSAANAAWTIYDWVTHERLSLDGAGDMPSRFFTYNLPTHEVVSKILTRCVNECRGLVVQVESADLRTAHMQSSISRMANLMGTEYVTRTRAYMNWIGDPSIDDGEYMRRQSVAASELDTKVLPAVFEYARINFLRIEQGALGAIEDLNEQAKNSHPGSGHSDRPATT